MNLPQHEAELSDNGLSMEELYKRFRKRAETKSNHAYVDKGENPVMMILNINNPVCDFQVGVLVKYKSFETIIKDDEEIGFQAIIYSGFAEGSYLLKVFRIGKAFLEKIVDK